MNAVNCPSRDVLTGYLAGRVSDVEWDSISTHVNTCANCREALETLSGEGDSLVAAIRAQPAPDAYSSEAACREAVQRVAELGRDPTFTATTAIQIQPVEPPRRIRDYELLQELGRGGMGAVYKALHTQLEKIVAVKVLTKERTRDTGAVARFKREMKAVGRLDHPQIVRALDAGVDGQTHFLVMEYVEGLDLGALVSRVGPLGIADACELIRQASEGLQHAHEHGLVHRDIKPSNLMLAWTAKSPATGSRSVDHATSSASVGQGASGGMSPAVKILDLGLALLNDQQPCVGGELTGTSQIMGTVDYMAPEQGESSHAVDIRADIYALGCTLFKLLTGHAPYSAKEYDTPLKKVLAHIRQPLPDVRARRPDVPATLAAVLQKMLAKSPAERFATPAEVAAVLAPFAAAANLRAVVEGAHCRGGRAYAPGENEDDIAVALTGSSKHAETDATVLATPTGISRRLPARSVPRITFRVLRWLLISAAAVVILFGIVLTVRTPQGTIVLTMDQPEIAGAEVSVDDQKKITICTGKDDEPISVAVDEKTHLLKVTKGGFETFTREFTVRKVNNAPIRVRLVPLDTNVAAAARSPAADNAGWHGWPKDAPSPAIAPFTPEQAKRHQEAWAGHLGVPVEYTNAIGMKFRLMPPGEFLMGDPAETIKVRLQKLPDERRSEWWLAKIEGDGPEHRVILTQPWYLGIHEVTQQQYGIVMGHNPSHFAETGQDKGLAEKVAGLDTSSHPVENVSWNDVAEFCAKLCEKENFPPTYARSGGESMTGLKGNGYRLPTEAEWEFSCRAAGDQWTANNGDEFLAAAWVNTNSGGQTHAVGELAPNPFGLFDLYGNVREWCHDIWEKTYYAQFADAPAIDPRGPESSGGQIHPIRGGCWRMGTIPASGRAPFNAAVHDPVYGFRVALSVDAVREALKQERTTISQPAEGWHGWPKDAPPPAIAPFTAEQAEQHQESWAKYLGVSAEYTNSIGMKFRLIPPGECKAGSSQAEIDDYVAKATAASEPPFRIQFLKEEGPQRQVPVNRAFYFGAHEVTQADWQSAMGSNPSTHRASEDLPVEGISWLDAVAFCNRLSERERRSPSYRIDGEKVEFVEADGYRLPLVDEWEYACRAGTLTQYFFGDEPATLGEYAWFRDNSARQTHPVGRKRANAFGLHDIYGNVCELALRNKGATMNQGQPQRGMAYINSAAYVRSAATVSGGREASAPWVGLRLLLPVSSAK